MDELLLLLNLLLTAILKVTKVDLTAKVNLVPIFQRLDNTIQWVNDYPVDSVVCFGNTYPLNMGGTVA